MIIWVPREATPFTRWYPVLCGAFQAGFPAALLGVAWAPVGVLVGLTLWGGMRWWFHTKRWELGPGHIGRETLPPDVVVWIVERRDDWAVFLCGHRILEGAPRDEAVTFGRSCASALQRPAHVFPEGPELAVFLDAFYARQVRPPAHLAHVVPVAPMTPRYQQIVGELRWLEAEIRRRMGQASDDVPEALLALRAG